MARFILTLTVDDPDIESIEDVRYLIDRAWADENTGRAVSFNGTRPQGGQVSMVALVDSDSFGIKAVS